MIRWLVDDLHSSAVTIFGYPVFGDDDTPKIIDWLHTIFTNISEAKYWVLYRFHPRHQHHIIRTGLKPGYWCQDTLILHGSMACLEAYVKQHGGQESLDNFSDQLRSTPEDSMVESLERQAGMQSEALAIYRWWKYEKPKDEARHDALVTTLYGKRDTVTYVPCPDNPKLSQMIFKEFEGDELAQEKEMRALDQKIADDEQSMLHRLINIRNGLWV